VAFAGPASVLPFEEEDVKTVGRVRTAVEPAGQPIGAQDLLIAGRALGYKLAEKNKGTRL
jgi:predicted nucleic acid-binding protein